MTVQPPSAWQAPEVPAGPAPGVRFAGPGARLAAFIIDGLIQVAVFLLLLVVLGAIVSGTMAAAGAAGAGAAVAGFILAILGYVLFSLLYFPWFWARGGQTPGMKAMAIRVVRDVDGGPVDFGAAVLRLIGYWINGMTLYIGFIWIVVDKRRRGWHDLIAGTVVVDA